VSAPAFSEKTVYAILIFDPKKKKQGTDAMPFICPSTCTSISISLLRPSADIRLD